MDLKKLDKFFRERFAKQMLNLNSGIILAAEVEGCYVVPTAVVGRGGGIAWKDKEGRPEKVKPAQVGIEEKRLEPFNIFYSVEIPYAEMELASTNQPYFNHLMDGIMKQALSNYQATVGSPTKTRFGSYYCQVERHDGSIFAMETSETVSITFSGRWAEET